MGTAGGGLRRLHADRRPDRAGAGPGPGRDADPAPDLDPGLRRHCGPGRLPVRQGGARLARLADAVRPDRPGLCLQILVDRPRRDPAPRHRHGDQQRLRRLCRLRLPGRGPAADADVDLPADGGRQPDHGLRLSAHRRAPVRQRRALARPLVREESDGPGHGRWRHLGRRDPGGGPDRRRRAPALGAGADLRALHPAGPGDAVQDVPAVLDAGRRPGRGLVGSAPGRRRDHYRGRLAGWSSRPWAPGSGTPIRP